MSDRKLAHVETIAALEPIEGADFIEVARILGWRVVVKKGEFKVGDKCVYFEIDSILPKSAWNEFLVDPSRSDRTIRLRTKKMRGVISQGLALPVGSFSISIGDEIGFDATELLGVKKYEPPCDGGDLRAVGLRPYWIPKTDEERIQNIPEIVSRLAVDQFYVSVKMDGSSMSIGNHPQHGMCVCTRNMALKMDADNRFTLLAREYADRIPVGYVVQGEAVGPGFNGNRVGLTECEWMVFDVIEIDTGRRLPLSDMIYFIKQYGLKNVPLFGYYIDNDVSSVDLILETAAKAEYKPGVPAEGLVFRATDQSWSFKAISNKYLLKNGE